MTANKDLKRLVRARMLKTGEAYTTARAALLKKRPSKAAARTVAVARPPKPAPQVSLQPTPSEYAKIAGMSDDALKEKTGCTWEKWVNALDRHGAVSKSHAEIAELIRKKYKTGDWWTQMVAVGYERIKGLRTRGQNRDGSFRASKSRTFAVPVDVLFDAWNEATTRKRWLDGAATRVRTATRPKSMRIDWEDGTIVSVNFAPKGKGKSSAAIEQVKLPNRDAVAQTKDAWATRFDALAEILATG